MAFKAVLVLSILAQATAAVLALRLNRRYRWHSAWLMISAAATLMAIQQIATLFAIWDVHQEVFLAIPLWTASLSTLLVSVLFLGGVALIEPLFREIAKANHILEREKNRLASTVQNTEDDMRLARHIQQNLLPRHSPQLTGFDIAGVSLPAEWTSGDYFDYIKMNDGTYSFVIADVSGHGTGPALLMSGTRALLRAFAQAHCDVGAILTLANRSIAADVTLGRFVTVFLAQIDPQARTVVYAAAGHDAFLIKASGEPVSLATKSPPLGAMPDLVVDAEPAMTLGDGEILLLVTDGIVETQSPSNEYFGVERMIDVVRRHRDKSASGIVEALFAAVREFADHIPQNDDNTAVVIKVVA